MVQLLPGAALVGLLAIAAWHDVRRRIIPNWIPAALVLLWLGWMAAEGRLAPAAGAVSMAALVLTAGYLAWLGGLLGGGDVKLLAATALWVGAAGLTSFLLATAIVGGVLALAIALMRRIAAARWRGRRAGAATPPASGAAAVEVPAPTAAFTSVPYAAAILAGGVWWWLAAHPF